MDVGMKIDRLTVLCSIMAMLIAVPSSSQELEEYRLGPQDKIEIKAYDLRAGSVDAHEWAPLNSEFVINSNGEILLPLVGAITANGKSLNNLTREIAIALQNKVGLTMPPSVSAQITKYRPTYVTGDVQKPGEYEFRPGLTVMQAVSLAGGIIKDAFGQQTDLRRRLTAAYGELHLLEEERSSLRIKALRLDAEIAGKDKIDPSEFSVDSNLIEKFKRNIAEEGMILQAHRELYNSQVEIINKNKVQLAQELSALEAKGAAVLRRSESIKRELSQVRELVSRGLAISSRELAAEQASTSSETSLLDIQISTARARQDVTKLDRDLIQLRTKMRDDALRDSSDVRLKISSLAIKIGNIKDQIIDLSSSVALSHGAGDVRDYSFEVLRAQLNSTGNQVAGTAMVGFADRLYPGDVLIVRPKSEDKAVARETNRIN